jgi:hypothetical protein
MYARCDGGHKALCPPSAEAVHCSLSAPLSRAAPEARRDRRGMPPLRDSQLLSRTGGLCGTDLTVSGNAVLRGRRATFARPGDIATLSVDHVTAVTL